MRSLGTAIFEFFDVFSCLSQIRDDESTTDFTLQTSSGNRTCQIRQLDSLRSTPPPHTHEMQHVKQLKRSETTTVYSLIVITFKASLANWILFDPIKGLPFPANMKSPPKPLKFTTYEYFKLGNPKILAYSTVSDSVTLKTTPAGFEGYEVSYLAAGPKLVKVKSPRAQPVRKTNARYLSPFERFAHDLLHDAASQRNRQPHFELRYAFVHLLAGFVYLELLNHEQLHLHDYVLTRFAFIVRSGFIYFSCHRRAFRFGKQQRDYLSLNFDGIQHECWPRAKHTREVNDKEAEAAPALKKHKAIPKSKK
ncbi:hypothetical protein PRZ48_012524 [Zasmidium cellare]|uniref:Uncharacterized protein n=1 Tax=Zasmidium cellare TaxID=395010 RepID=A0ABR0E5D8_ZASCE|nr:hypothetical protein PRZ48_012524 [Zasmidium cellare]